MDAGGVAARTTALILLFLGTILCGTLPIVIIRKLQRSQTSLQNSSRKGIAGNLVTSFLMCFGGGVLFATCFIHLLPDVRESFEHAVAPHEDHSGNETFGTHEEKSGGHSHEFPLPEFLVCAGFLAVYFIEEVLHAALGHNHHGPKEGPEVHGHSHSPAVLNCNNRDAELSTSPTVMISSGSGSTRRRTTPEPSHLTTTNLTSIKSEISYGSTDVVAPSTPVNTARSNGLDNSNGFDHSIENGSTKKEIVLTPSEWASKPNSLSPNQEPAHSHGANQPAHQHSHGLGGTGAHVQLSIGGLLIVVALSFHSIFEGLAIGLQKSTRDVWTTFIAVAIHKFVISFVVGLEVYAEGTRALVVVIYMVIFAFMSPLGIIIGMVFQITLTGKMDVAIGYLNALATGTLLYVTFFEVLQREKNSQLSGLLQFLAVILGFGLMVLINMYGE